VGCPSRSTRPAAPAGSRPEDSREMPAWKVWRQFMYPGHPRRAATRM
jgi:hypothetical protein